ncbi:MAG: DRTGG domain-containing protein [Anaerolineae bacterium]|jgi:predicted transcriptional regulator|nr:DRTGG domain-containing protein [Anaerolineae bacterium]MDH7474517.1 DRTGG domain-containing protein [Anaerolineae bacterium]
MKLRDIISIVEGTLVTSNADLDMDIPCACGADLMSDVLTHAKAGALLLTGLVNPQVIRTAEMADIAAIVFVRGKYPPPETIALAEEKGIPLVAAKYTMFEMCGRLFEAGMSSCDVSR